MKSEEYYEIKGIQFAIDIGPKISFQLTELEEPGKVFLVIPDRDIQARVNIHVRAFSFVLDIE